MKVLTEYLEWALEFGYAVAITSAAVSGSSLSSRLPKPSILNKTSFSSSVL